MKSEFDALIKDLVILSSKKEEQMNLIGNGNVGTEMLINFGISNQNLNSFIEQKLIDENQKENLEHFQLYIDENADLDDNLDSEEWSKTRLLAKDILKILNSSHLKVYLDKSGKFWEAKLLT